MLVHKQPCCDYLSNEVFLTFKIDLFSSLFLLQKAYKKQVICYSIAVKNACFCWVTECIAPSIHALTARIATELLECEGYFFCFVHLS